MEGEDDLGPIVPLHRGHEVREFECGVPELNEYLQKYARQNQERYHSARTFVACRGARVVGYYTLAYGSISRDLAPPRVGKGTGRYDIPVIVLGRLAVDKAEQGRKLGVGLLKDAVLRASKAAEHAGLKAMLVHAIDEKARAFYLRASFEESPLQARTLFLSIEDILATARAVAQSQPGPAHDSHLAGPPERA